MLYIKDGQRYSQNQIDRALYGTDIAPGQAGFSKLYDIKPAYDELTEQLVDSGNVLVDGQWSIDWGVVSKTPSTEAIDNLRAEIKQKIADMVLLKLYQNSLFDFGGASGYVQLRNQRDESNLHTAATNATIMHVVGDGALIVEFRDAANVVHTPTATHFMNECKRFFDAKQNIYKASWTHKEAIKLLTTVEDLRNYDYSTGWPT